MIILEEHVVRSFYDPATNLCHYTVLYRGAHYSLTVPKQHFDKYGGAPGHQGMRRNHLLKAIAARLKQPPDEAPPPENVLRHDPPPPAAEANPS